MPITPVTKLLFSKVYVRKEYPVLLNRLIESNSDINITTSSHTDNDDDNDDIDSSTIDDTNDDKKNTYSSECSKNEGMLLLYALFCVYYVM